MPPLQRNQAPNKALLRIALGGGGTLNSHDKRVLFFTSQDNLTPTLCRTDMTPKVWLLACMG